MKWSKNTGLYAIVGLVIVFFGVRFFSMNFSNGVIENDSIKKIVSEQAFRNILNESRSKMMVVDFYADWCGPCKMLHPILSALAAKYSGRVDFYKVNVDENSGLASEFGAQAIPYVVFIKNKKIITTFTGVKSSSTYETIIIKSADLTGTFDKATKSL